MENLICGLCTEYFDRASHCPLKVTCLVQSHNFCASCLERMQKNKTSTCPIDNSDLQTTQDINDLPIATEICRFLEDNEIFCFAHNQSQAIGFDVKNDQAYCESENKPKKGSEDIQNSVLSKFIDFYLENKKILSFEMRQNFSLSLKNLKLQEILNFLYDMKIYKSAKKVKKNEEFYLTYFSSDRFQEYFQVIPPNITEFRDKLTWIIINLINYCVDQRTLLYSSTLKFWSNIEDIPKEIMFIECYYMAKGTAVSLSNIPCLRCGKGFQLGIRMPIKLQCSHLLCYLCCINSAFTCVICLEYSNSYEPVYDDSIYNTSMCNTCGKRNQISLNNLPFHSLCDCTICETCINYNSIKKCLQHNKAGYFDTKNFLKVHKKVINSKLYLKIDILCAVCQQEASVYFSKYQHIPVCKTCDRRDNTLSTISMGHPKKFDEFLIKNYNSHFHKENFVALSLNRKLELIKNIAMNNQYSTDIYQYTHLSILKRFTVIYPLHNKDRRYFTVTSDIQLKATTNNNISLHGIIVSGKTDESFITVKAVVNTQSIEKQFRGKEGFLILQSSIISSEFDIKLTYEANLKIYTGKLLDSQEIETKSNIKFYFSSLSPDFRFDLMGPVLGLIYSYS